eukprot:284619_1
MSQDSYKSPSNQQITWSKALQIGDKIDVSKKNNGWYIARVEDKNDQQLQIMYEDFSEDDSDTDDYKWIDYNDNKLQPFQIHTLNNTEYNMKIGDTACDPIFYKNPTNKRSYILMPTVHNENDNLIEEDVEYGVHIYRIKSDIWTCFPFIKTDHHRDSTHNLSFLDKQNNKIYIMNEYNVSILDLQEKANPWTMTLINPKHKPEQNICGCIANSVIYTMQYGQASQDNSKYAKPRFMKYDLIQCKTSEITKYPTYNFKIYGAKMIYCSAQNKLLLFFAFTKVYIWEYDFNNDLWKISDIKLPNCLPPTLCFVPIYAFDGVLCIFNYTEYGGRQIWFLDIVNNKWYKSKKTFPVKIALSSVKGVKTDTNDIHFFQCDTFFYEYHFKISLYDVIPDALSNVYRKYYSILIDGFCRNAEMEYEYYVATEINFVILNYFPLFL